jgi:hypothetical protein
MLFLTLYTPATKREGPPPADLIARMGDLMARASEAGTLVSTGPLGRSATGGARVRLAKGHVTVTIDPDGESALMRAEGYALLRAADREDAIRQVTEFLGVVGDGHSELIEIVNGAPRD